VIEEFGTYIKGMKKRGVWGGDIEISAASKVFDVQIIHVEVDPSKTKKGQLNIKKVLTYNSFAKRTLMLVYLRSKNHYESIQGKLVRLIPKNDAPTLYKRHRVRFKVT